MILTRSMSFLFCVLIRRLTPSIQKDWELLATKLHEVSVYQHMPSKLIGLLVAAEDHRFNFHNGVDFRSIVRAFWKTVFHKKRQGGSTIAMQLVRVLTERYEYTLSRKITEMYCALMLEHYLTKQEQANIYLSLAYFGWDMVGVTQACQRLSYNFQSLTIPQMAGIIARLKYPEPRKESAIKTKKIILRSEYILKRYRKLRLSPDYGWI